MKPSLRFALCMLLLVPATAFAQINVGWGDSPTRGAATTQPFDCQGDAGEHTLVFSFAPTSDMTGVTAFLLDLTTVAGTGAICDPFGDPGGCVPDPLPPYWDLTPGTGCRSGAVSAGTAFPAVGANPAVEDPWNGTLQIATQPWFLQTKTGGQPGHEEQYTVGRYQVVGYLAPGDTVNLLAGHEYFMATITFRNTKSAAGGCDGCCTSVVFQPLFEIARTGGTVTNFTNLLDAPPVWQGAQGAALCSQVPVRSRTWGALKSAYR